MSKNNCVEKKHFWSKKAKVLTATAFICAFMLYGKISNADNISLANLFISNAFAAEKNSCTPDSERISHLKSASQGFFKKMRFAEKPYDLSDIAFTDSNNQEKRLSDFKGKVLLVNFWAMWCPPCRQEMPELAGLKTALESDDFDVLTINLDKSSDEKILNFLKEIGAENLEMYRDSSMKSFNGLRRQSLAFGLPATILLDEKGCVLASYNGSAPWNDADANALIKAAIETKTDKTKTNEDNNTEPSKNKNLNNPTTP